MSVEYSDDILFEEEDTAIDSFLIAAGSIIVVSIFLAANLLAYFLMQRGEVEDEVVHIKAHNNTT